MTRLLGRLRPTVTEEGGSAYGYHVWDLGLAQDNLVSDVAAAEITWTHGGGGLAGRPAGASCAAGDPVEDGAEPEPELIVGEVGRRGGRALGHGGDQAGEASGVGQPQ